MTTRNDAKELIHDILTIDFNTVTWVSVSKFFPVHIYISSNDMVSFLINTKGAKNYYRYKTTALSYHHVDIGSFRRDTLDSSTYFEKTQDKTLWHKFKNERHPIHREQAMYEQPIHKYYRNKQSQASKFNKRKRVSDDKRGSTKKRKLSDSVVKLVSIMKTLSNQ